MNIKIKKFGKRTQKEYEINKINFCCDKMEEAWSEKYIILGEMDSIFQYNKDVNICHCYPYPEGAVYDEMPIYYCPFCGKKIVIEEKVK